MSRSLIATLEGAWLYACYSLGSHRAAAATALEQARIRDLARAHFAPAFPEIDRYISVFRHAQIDATLLRGSAGMVRNTAQRFKQCNDLFITAATELRCCGCVGACLSAAGCIRWTRSTN